MKKALFSIIMLLLGFAVGYYSRPQTDIIVKTEYKTDTLRVIKPAEIKVDTFFREVFIPIKQAVDTVFKMDSVLVYLPFERKVYEDSTYRAVVSGYRPVLEEIDVYGKETIIYKEKTAPRLSPYVSGSIGLNGDVSLGGGVFFKDKDALGMEWSNRGLQIRYIHKF